jgi:leucine dehydrogenase
MASTTATKPNAPKNGAANGVGVVERTMITPASAGVARQEHHGMDLINQLYDGEFEKFVAFTDRRVGLKAIVAIHSTLLGPALGGTRVMPYETSEQAMTDVLRLARGMTYKAAAANLPLGGGKAVIMAHPEQINPDMLVAFGDFVESLGGKYYTAEDIGMTPAFMSIVRGRTKCVVGLPRDLGGGGSPSPFTARGVLHGMREALKFKLGTDSFQGVRVAIQGVGSVGRELAELILAEGGKLIIADAFEKFTQPFRGRDNCEFVGYEDIYESECEVFSPCAIGAILNDNTVPRLKAKIIAGCANNQLLDESRHAFMLQERGVLYCPDYVINAGGLINVAEELNIGGYREERSLMMIKTIAASMKTIFERATRDGITTAEAARRLAEERLHEARERRLRQPQLMIPNGLSHTMAGAPV